jgi:pyruvate/2-oxoglutarate dehydrogenase complex dihydrolipoamide acyltransferase (E2) component
MEEELMAEAIVMPKMGLTMEEGKVTDWLVREGDAVTAGQPVVEIETYKATMELESPIDGVLRAHIAAGETVPVGTIVAIVGDPAESIDLELGRILGSEDTPAAPTPAAAPERDVAPAAAPRDRSGRSVSPAARRRARELGVDPEAIEGTGPGGRVGVEDVERAANGADGTA